MDITFNCDACEQSISIDEAGAGSIVDCPKCRARVLVPNKSTPTASLRKAVPQSVIVEKIQGLPLTVKTGYEPLQVKIVGVRVSWDEAYDVTVKVFCCLSAFTLLLALLLAIFAWILKSLGVLAGFHVAE